MTLPIEKVVLKSTDGETFEVDEAILLQSQVIKHLVENVSAHNTIPIPNASSKILTKVIEYCRKHVESSKSNDQSTIEELKAFDNEFVMVDQRTLLELIQVANYLEIKGLLDLTCQRVADILMQKTPKEIKDIFKIIDDFIPEVKEEIPKECLWKMFW